MYGLLYLNDSICPLLKIYSLFNTIPFFSGSNIICFKGMKSNAAKIKFIFALKFIHCNETSQKFLYLLLMSWARKIHVFYLNGSSPSVFKCFWPLFKCVGSKTTRKPHSFYTFLFILFTEKNLTLSISLFINCGESASFWKFKLTCTITLDVSKKLGVSDYWNEKRDMWYHRIYKTIGRFSGYSFADG